MKDDLETIDSRTSLSDCGKFRLMLANDYTNVMGQLSMWRDEMRMAARKPFLSVFLDGRNEHGSHVLFGCESSIPGEQYHKDIQSMLEDQEEGLAEKILTEAELMGFEINHYVVTTWSHTTGDGPGTDYFEYDGISWALTALFFGTPDQQNKCHEEAAQCDTDL